MSRFWSPLVHRLQPYVAGEQPAVEGLVKLNTNENPYGPSPRAIAAIAAQTTDSLRFYPDPTSQALRETIAAHHHLQPEQIFVGNGSDEVLAHVFQAFLKQEQPLLFPDVTYSFYPSYCRLFGVEYCEIALDDAMRVDLADYRRSCGGVILANPNAPTGIALARGDIETLLRDHPDQPVVIDEAYVDFGAESVVPLIAAYPNLVVIHTLSKSRALAGLRVGVALGQPPMIQALERVKDSFNSYPLDRLAQAGAAAAYEDAAWFDQTRARVMATRARLSQALQHLGFEVAPSSANFVFARHPSYGGEALAEALRVKNILVRRFNRPRIADWLRISVGSEAQCDRLLAALQIILRDNGDNGMSVASSAQ